SVQLRPGRGAARRGARRVPTAPALAVPCPPRLAARPTPARRRTALSTAPAWHDALAVRHDRARAARAPGAGARLPRLHAAPPAAERQYRWADKRTVDVAERREEVMTPLEANLRAFFEEYARTFHQSVEGFCDLYEFPSETVRLDGTVQRFYTKGAAVEFFTL